MFCVYKHIYHPSYRAHAYKFTCIYAYINTLCKYIIYNLDLLLRYLVDNIIIIAVYNSHEQFVSSAISGVVSNMEHRRLGKKKLSVKNLTYCRGKGYSLALTGSVWCEPELNDNNAHCWNSGLVEKAFTVANTWTGCGTLLVFTLRRLGARHC